MTVGAAVHVSMTSDVGLVYDLYVRRDGQIVQAWFAGELVADTGTIAELQEQVKAEAVAAAWWLVDRAAGVA